MDGILLYPLIPSPRRELVLAGSTIVVLGAAEPMLPASYSRTGQQRRAVGKMDMVESRRLQSATVN